MEQGESPGLLQWAPCPLPSLSSTLPGYPATHLLCLVCWGNEDYERRQLGCADDLQGLWRKGCSYQCVAIPQGGKKHRWLAAVPHYPMPLPSQGAMVPVMQWWVKGATPSLGPWALWVDSGAWG